MRKEKSIEAITAFETYKKRKKEIIDNYRSLPGLKTQKYYYPLTQFLLSMLTLFNGESITYLNDRIIVTPKNRPVIHACTHKFKPDMEKISISINKPSVLMASDFINSYKSISGWYFRTRPTIFIDPYSKEDKNYSYKIMVRYLKEGCDFMIFPEGVWNLSENEIVLGTFLGTVRAALESNAIIVCNAIERYGKEYIINRKGYFDPTLILKKYTEKSFEELNVNTQSNDWFKDILIECNECLRDTMATRTFEIWMDHAERFGVERREELPDDYWQQFVTGLTLEWPGYKMSDFWEQRYYSKAQIEQKQVQADLCAIRPET